MKVGLITAMNQEAEAYYPKALNAVYEVQEHEGTLVRISGIGKVNASIATKELIDAGAEAILIGGVCATLAIEDLLKTYLLTSAMQHDYGVQTSEIETYRPGSVPGEAREKIWYEADLQLKAVGIQHAEFLGSIATGDQFMSSPTRVAFLHNNMKANVLDMETAAVAQTCHTYSIPWIGLKTTTDKASGGSAEEFWKNLPKAAGMNAVTGRRIIADLQANPRFIIN